ncbi:MAG: ribosomal protein L7/L12 [Rickettsiaceae bacterium H1]|nr:ribosomal protein L7/L12 [Rickettsiaceae bacterium H1]
MVEKKVDLEGLASQICTLPLMEASELVKILKEKLNIQDLPVMSHAPVMPSGSEKSEGGGASDQPVKDEVLLMLKSFDGSKKAKAIKALREVKKKEGVDIGVKEAKEMIESSPITICENIPANKAEQYSQLFKDAGCEVEIK